MKDYASYRSAAMDAGQLYQDFVVCELHRQLGIVIPQFASKEFQIGVGESLTGHEIKLDRRLHKTGNIYIEMGEKARPRPGGYFPSGIYRNDNSRTFIIGDYREIYLFDIPRLRGESESGKYREVTTPTSHGLLLPKGDAARIANQVVIVESIPQWVSEKAKHLGLALENAK